MRACPPVVTPKPVSRCWRRRASKRRRVRTGQRLGAFELWVRASQEPEARLVMGLSGRSVIRLTRPGEREGKG